MTDKAVKKTVFYGRDGKPETKYFGVRDSDRFIRIYNTISLLSSISTRHK
jgi:DNA relaxase NicK